MNNQAPQELGMNKTGIKMSPKESVKTAEGAQKLTPQAAEVNNSLGENRLRFIEEAGPAGTVPLPGPLRGGLTALAEKVKQGDHTFMDKLGERIAFERTGTRLYEALISKYHGSEDKSTYPDLQILERFCREERQHFILASEAMEKIGGDCTAVTPSANVAAVAGMGWVQVIADPRTTFKQSLEVILQAELVDNACWEVLIEVARDVGLKTVAEDFQKCLEEEAVHLATIKDWVRQFNLNNRVQLTQ